MVKIALIHCTQNVKEKGERDSKNLVTQTKLDRRSTIIVITTWRIHSALKDHEKSDLDPNQDHLPKSDLRSRSDPDLTLKYDLQIVI